MTKPLSQTDYGIINLYSPFLAFLMPFVTGGILYPLSAEYFKRDPADYRKYFTNAQVIPLISVTALTVGCFVAVGPLTRFLHVSPIWVYMMPIVAWLIYVNETSLVMARNKNNPLLFAGFSFGKNLVEMALTLGLVVGLSWGWQGRLSSAALAPLFFFFVAIWYFKRWNLLEKEVDWGLVKKIFLFSIPFVFERMSIFVLNNSDKYFIDKFDLRGTAGVGLYGLAAQFASIIFLVVQSMNGAYHPFLFKKLSEGHQHRLHKSTGWYILACAGMAVALCISLPLLFRWFIHPKFHDALPYTYVLIGGYFMWGIYNAFVGYLVYIGKNREILYISLIGMVISLIANSYFVPRLGATGAAYTSLGTYTATAILSYLFVKKHFIEKNLNNEYP